MEETLFTLGRKFSEICHTFQGRIALQIHLAGQDYYSYTYQDLWIGAQKVGNWLITQNIKKQDRVAIILENSYQWVIIYFGIMLAGAVAVPLDPQMSKETIFTLLEDSEAKIVFSQEKLKPIFDIISDGLISLKRIILVRLKEDGLPF